MWPGRPLQASAHNPDGAAARERQRRARHCLPARLRPAFQAAALSKAQAHCGSAEPVQRPPPALLQGRTVRPPRPATMLHRRPRHHPMQPAVRHGLRRATGSARRPRRRCLRWNPPRRRHRRRQRACRTGSCRDGRSWRNCWQPERNRRCACAIRRRQRPVHSRAAACHPRGCASSCHRGTRPAVRGGSCAATCGHCPRPCGRKASRMSGNSRRRQPGTSARSRAGSRVSRREDTSPSPSPACAGFSGRRRGCASATSNW